ncbi:PRC-barrel domain-containing protein [Allorhizobium undicola]|uniref:PRC-barrel domain-containing protein n=1 Tax=Allorhizobium undicola TaxID=78527 RepID=UPI000569D755|nr:PRC-barrel domain-containing protein [Allorhizobium undicola]
MKKSINIFAAAAIAGTTALAPMAFAQSATTTAPAATPAAPAASMTGGTYLTQQGSDQMAATNFIGQNVYTSDNKSIGEVNDLIMQQNGGVVAVVIGVGGFLGMGEKDVAMPLDKITMTRDAKDNNKLRLTTMETADALKSAPEFKRLEDMRDGSTTSSTTTTTTK